MISNDNIFYNKKYKIIENLSCIGFVLFTQGFKLSFSMIIHAMPMKTKLVLIKISSTSAKCERFSSNIDMVNTDVCSLHSFDVEFEFVAFLSRAAAIG